MPTLAIYTNVPKAKIPDGFLTEASKIFQAAIGKPMEYINVYIIPDVQMAFAGTTEPCAKIDVMSIGKLGPEQNLAISKIVYDLIESKLGIADNRAYIVFTDKPRHEVGFKHSTIAELFK